MQWQFQAVETKKFFEFFESCGMSIGVKKTKGQLIRAVNRIQGKELCETMKLAQRKFVRPDSGMAICRLTEKNGTGQTKM